MSSLLTITQCEISVSYGGGYEDDSLLVGYMAPRRLIQHTDVSDMVFHAWRTLAETVIVCEILDSHGGEYEV
jgi:hypothetical protein